MLQTAYVYRSPQGVFGLYDHLFGGLFLIWGLPIALQLVVFLSLLLGIGACVKYRRTPLPVWERTARLCAMVGFLCSLVLTFHPWDELFINLRHAEHWSNDGLFSFNRFQKIEGTVDFLFYFLVGILKRVGVPVVEAALALSSLGGWLIVAAGRQTLRDHRREELIPAVTLALAFFPPLLFTSASGFSATFFTAAILWSLLAVSRSAPSPLLFFLMAVVPLIRFEGIYWTALVGTYGYLKFRGERKTFMVWGAIAAVVPFALLSLWRLQTFGNIVPNPARFKATWASFFFLGIGATNLVTDFISTATVASLVVVFLGLSDGEWRKKGSRALVLLPLYVLPYYLTGGDWFPCYWGRFLLPLSVTSYFLAVITLLDSKREGSVGSPTFLCGILLYSIPLAWPFYSFARWAEVNFSPRWIVANPRVTSVKKSLSRAHYLSQLGTHLREATEPSDVIASSEVATVMFYAQREALDMLGVANPEIAVQPLREPPSFRRELYGRSQLPHRIFRRSQPGLIEKYRPAILFTFDFIPSDISNDVTFEELDAETLKRIIKRWEVRVGGLVDPLYGGFSHLTAIGYRPIVILYANQFCSLYFVSAEVFERHTARLEAMGMKGTTLPIRTPTKAPGPGRRQ